MPIARGERINYNLFNDVMGEPGLGEGSMHQHGRLLLRMSICLVVGLLVVASAAGAQDAVDLHPSLGVKEREAILRSIRSSIEQLERELEAKQEELRSPRAEGRREELTQQIRGLGDRLVALQERFDEIASGVDLKAFSKKEEVELDWNKRLLELIRPVLNEVRRLTAHPREIDQLRREIEGYQEQRRLAEKALDNLEKLTGQIQDPALRSSLLQAQQQWEARRQEIGTQWSIANQQLEEKLGEKKPLAESVKDIFQIFFRSRGRNFLLACLAFVAFWVLFQRLHSWTQRIRLLRRKQRTFYGRLFNVLNVCFRVLGATLAFLLVLYLFGDWVLLTLAIMFLLGIAWTSKTALPRFWKEALLLLNMGTVREGERVLYNGVPWLVQSLSFKPRLVNPELSGGELRLPLNDLFELRSRPFEHGEPWFPTRHGDWVLLDDEKLGKVVLQTPEMVRIVLLGGSTRIFSASEFITQCPTVLSTGFRHRVLFGIDYQHQALVTQEIPAQLKSRLHQELAREGYEKEIVNLVVEFEEAAASALNLVVIIDFSGTAAPKYWTLRRAMQRICVDACNDYGWVIPFPQLTLHMASDSETVQRSTFDVQR